MPSKSAMSKLMQGAYTGVFSEDLKKQYKDCWADKNQSIAEIARCEQEDIDATNTPMNMKRKWTP